MSPGALRLDDWRPASPAEAAGWFGRAGVPWWVAGGYAIELAAGRPLREHGDLDILLLRRDQLAVQRALPDWEWWAADPPGTLRPWAPGEILPAGVHDIWCRPGPGAPWRVQIMLDEARGRTWYSRRDPRVRRPVGTLGLWSATGVPYLAPEVQLYYKARATRPKDEADFAAVLPCLGAERRAWLVRALASTPGGHPWLPRLRGG